ncbi:MAG: prephenate dehydratase [Gammaproteobacteria bacterium]
MNSKKTLTHPRVAFQGELGAFSTEAAYKFLGKEIELLPYRTFDEIFSKVVTSAVEYAIVPIENSLFGAIYQNYDLLLQQPCIIVAETFLRIVHNLIVLPDVSLEQVKRVYSHPVALAQCSRFFIEHPHLQPVVNYDTAGSVKQLVETQTRDAAAIASATAASIYHAKVILTGIEDDKQNFTRFLLIKQATNTDLETDDADKISLVFALENSTGSLYRALAVFALRNIELTKIESRPLIGHPWEYHFYVDCIGQLSDLNIQNALKNLKEFASYVKVLGCYRRI